MSYRINSHSEVCRLFGFLARVNDLDQNELSKAAELLIRTYKSGFEESLGGEFIQLSSLSVAYFSNKGSVLR